MSFCPCSLKALITIWIQTIVVADDTTNDLVVVTIDNGKMCDFRPYSTFYSIKEIQVGLFADLSLEIGHSFMILHHYSSININAGLFLSIFYAIL